MNTILYCLWFDPTWNRTRFYRFSSRRSIHSTTDRLNAHILLKITLPLFLNIVLSSFACVKLIVVLHFSTLLGFLCLIFYQEWTSKFISIEDPFDLNHNLAAGVSHKMATFITNVFVKAREHFGTLPKIELRQIDECVSIIFNRACVMSAHQIPV